MQQELRFTNNLTETVDQILNPLDADKYFLLTDINTEKLCLPMLEELCEKYAIEKISVESGEEGKSVESLVKIWHVLSTRGASRRSVMINLGGGMITDMGGFAAASFKRGIRFFNIPTTLLGAVDAAVGGKTGINFEGLKNEVGAFAPAQAVLISTLFFETLDKENLLSGYAEMLKHGLIDQPSHYEALINYSIEDAQFESLLPLMELSVRYKEHIVTIDPFEKGIRKALNLGHTVGHAFESLALAQGKPVLHGYAVAWGLVCELILSHRQCAFPLSTLKEVAAFVKQHYGVFPLSCKEYEAIFEYMQHDKKNEGNGINFTLLEDIGKVSINQSTSKENIFAAFDIFRDLFGL